MTPKASTQQWEPQYDAMLKDWNLSMLAISQSCTDEAERPSYATGLESILLENV